MDRSEIPLVDVLRVKGLEGHRLWLRFTDGCEGEIDLTERLARGGPMLEPLRVQGFFERVFLEMGAPTWPNGFDLDPIALYIELREAGRLQSSQAAE